MIKFIFKSSLLLLILVLHSCSAVYEPTPSYPTGFTEARDLRVDASIGHIQLNSSLAFSPVKHVFVHGELTRNSLKESGNYNLSYSGGLGFYYSFSPAFSLESQIAIGEGDFSYSDNYYGGDQALTYGSGNYSNWSASLSAVLHQFNSQIGITARYNNILLHYKSAGGKPYYHYRGNSYFVDQFGVSVLFRKQLVGSLNFISSCELNIGIKNGFRMRTNPLGLRLGLEFKLKKFEHPTLSIE